MPADEPQGDRQPARLRERRGPLPTGIVTLVFTDVEGSTRLLRLLGPSYAPLLAAHNEIVCGVVTDHRGTVIRGEGDSFFCAFEDPAAAVEACLQTQIALTRFAWPEGAEFRVRIGLHTGPVELGGEDYVGLAVHQAARVGTAAHGGQVIVSEATRQLVGERLNSGVSFRALGRYRLKDFVEPTAIYQLCHPELPDSFPALRAAPAAAHNVPAQATVFVGRQTALRELREHVGANRLVTVLGAGGVGKTRLATELAPLAVEEFTDGVWMVELAKLRDGQAVAAEIGTTLGVRAEAERALEATIADALELKRLLLVLDNCEHVLDAVASLVESLLGACPRVHVLTTSREPLCLAGERRYPLAPLSLPDSTRDLDSSEAVALFIDRARVVAPGFDAVRERDAVIEICRRLDGLPLAIELAAARTASIPPSRIASRLDRRFSVLRSAQRGGLKHHETLRASIEWSYELLEDDERVLLRRLGVFSGKFELEAAEAICGIDPLDRDEMLDLLGRLIEKSLLQPADDGYLMLESIREFAREQAQDAGDDEAMIARHLEYYTGLVEEIARAGQGPDQRAAFDHLDAVLPEVRAAIQRALQRSDPMALRIAAGVGQYGFIRNRLAEVARWCIDAGAIPDAPPALRARALNQAGFALVVMGSPDGGQAVVDDGLALAREAGDPTLLGQLLLMAADLRIETGRLAAALPFAREAVDVVRGLDDDVMLGQALLFRAWAQLDEVGIGPTAQQMDESLQLFERAGAERQIGRVSILLSYMYLELGDLDRAEAHAERCLEMGSRLEHVIGDAMSGIALVWVALERGQLERAEELLDRCLTTASVSGYRTLMTYCVAAEAGVTAGRGDFEHAARLLGALRAEGAIDKLGGEGGRAISLRLRALEARLSDELGDRYAKLRVEGEQIALAQLAAQPR